MKTLKSNQMLPTSDEVRNRLTSFCELFELGKLESWDSEPKAYEVKPYYYIYFSTEEEKNQKYLFTQEKF